MLLRDSHTFVYEYPMDVFRAVIEYKPNLWHKIMAAVSIPGFIALVITITIYCLVLVGRADVPQILGAALTTILGFYFGKQASTHS